MTFNHRAPVSLGRGIERHTATKHRNQTPHTMTPLSSTSIFTFSLFGHLTGAQYLPDQDAVIFRVPGRRDDDTLPAADFLEQFGDAPTDGDRPELGTIGDRIHHVRIISQTLHDLYTMDDEHQRPGFTILAEWRERNAAHIRIQDDFGGYHTIRFEAEGRVFMLEHATWQQIATTRPEIAAS